MSKKVLLISIQTILAVACGSLIFLFASKSFCKSNAAAAPVQKAPETYEAKHERFIRRAKEGPMELLFIGDSLTEYWLNDGKDVWKTEFGKWKAGNFGISGDTTHGVLWRLNNGEIDGVHPKVAVVLIGTNDLSAGAKPEDVSANIEKIVRTIKTKLPRTKVVLLGLLPRGYAADKVRQSLAKVNELISKLDNGKDIRYLDIGKAYTDSKGELSLEIMPDLLHLSGKGYKIWADSMKPLLNECMG